MKYRKKPVVVEAIQYQYDTRAEIIEWVTENNGSIVSTGIDEDGAEYELENIRVRTLEGEMTANLGDWVIKGVQGEFYPCKPHIFEATYELIDEDYSIDPDYAESAE